VTNAIAAGFAPYEERQHVLDDIVRPWFAVAGADLR
jgi:hypothetical protein